MSEVEYSLGELIHEFIQEFNMTTSTHFESQSDDYCFLYEGKEAVPMAGIATLWLSNERLNAEPQSYWTIVAYSVERAESLREAAEALSMHFRVSIDIATREPQAPEGVYTNHPGNQRYTNRA